MSTIFLDIETIPRQDMKPDPLMVKVPANYKKEEAIKRYQEEHAEEAYRKLSLSKTGAQVIALSCAYNDEATVVMAYNDEYKVLKEFDNWLRALDTKTPLYAMFVCGFNLASFDLPIIWLRACKYNLFNIKELLPDKPYDDRLLDVMRMYAPTARGEYISMNELCKFFEIEGKGDIDGSKVYDYFLEGRLNDIATYCQEDVSKTRQLYNKLR